MAVTEEEVDQAEKRMAALRENGFAVSARYDRRSARVVVNLNTGVQIAFPTRMAEALADASPADLAEIEISPAGLGLHWPKLDADVYVPALLQGVFGSRGRIAAQLGSMGGKVRSRAKVAAARANGRKCDDRRRLGDSGLNRAARSTRPPLEGGPKPQSEAIAVSGRGN